MIFKPRGGRAKESGKRNFRSAECRDPRNKARTEKGVGICQGPDHGLQYSFKRFDPSQFRRAFEVVYAVKGPWLSIARVALRYISPRVPPYYTRVPELTPAIRYQIEGSSW